MLLNKLYALRTKTDQRLTALAMARQQVEREQMALAAAQADAAACQQAIWVAQQVAQTVQQQAHSRIADIVSQSLAAVFDEPYAFNIKFEQRRGRTEASLLFIRNGMEVDPMTASGGGVVDVASFALRLSCLMLSRPPCRRALIMDEPFRFLSSGYRDRVRELMLKLSKDLGVQFLLVTHAAELACGTVVHL